MSTVRSEDVPEYGTNAEETDDQVILKALIILKGRLREPGEKVNNPEATKKFLMLTLAEERNEKFCCLFLDNRHRLIEFETLFTGTVDGTSVYPRVVVQRALQLNAAAVILSHNHPSGEPQPSEADRRITRKLQDALGTVDIRVIDHLIVAGGWVMSFAERGYL